MTQSVAAPSSQDHLHIGSEDKWQQTVCPLEERQYTPLESTLNKDKCQGATKHSHWHDFSCLERPIMQLQFTRFWSLSQDLPLRHAHKRITWIPCSICIYDELCIYPESKCKQPYAIHKKELIWLKAETTDFHQQPRIKWLQIIIEYYCELQATESVMSRECSYYLLMTWFASNVAILLEEMLTEQP